MFWMLITSLQLLVAFSLGEAEHNLALYKTARQSSNYNQVFPASKAVNGQLDDFSHTKYKKAFNWWKVDLGKKYSLGNITLYGRNDTVEIQERLKFVYILLSNSPDEPSDPSLSSPDWVQLSYKEDPYPLVGRVEFTPPAEAQHVAVYNNHSKGLALREVQIYEYNYAAHKPSSQSSSYDNGKGTGGANDANDGDLSTSSHTDFINEKTNQWWKIDLQRGIVLREARVYVRNGLCNGGSVNCFSRLQEVYLLSNPTHTVAAPSTDGADGWSTCYYSNTPTEEFTTQCAIGLQHPITRLFSVRNNVGISVELKEVQIFGYELPQLTQAINLRTESTTSSAITISFLQWNQKMIGGFSPSQYHITLSGDSSQQTVPHINSTDPIRQNITFSQLNSGQVYNVNITCVIQGIDCPGDSHSIQVNTKYAVPQFTPDQLTVVAAMQGCVRLTWETPAYSGREIQNYKFLCDGKHEIQVNANNNTAQHCGYVPYTDVTCAVAAKNTEWSSWVNATVKTLCAAPNYIENITSNDMYDASSNTRAVYLEVKNVIPNCETLTSLEYRIGNGAYQNDASFRTLNATTNYTFTVKATNNAGNYSTTNVTVLTGETAPGTGPEYRIKFSSNCINISILPPKIPNGVIVSYQYQCQVAAEDFRGSYLAPADDDEDKVDLTRCGLPEATELRCNLYAETEVGASPATVLSRFIPARLSSSRAPQLLPPDGQGSTLQRVKLLELELESQLLDIRSYLVLLNTEPDMIGACDLARNNCITIAEIESELITEEGYIFYIGDDEVYGGYTNSPLEPEALYSVQTAISVKILESGDIFYQIIPGTISFSASPHYCQMPPKIENAIAGTGNEVKIGESVLYACENGYQRLEGDAQLTCAITDEYTTQWIGKHLVCSKTLSIGLGSALGALGFVAILVGVAKYVQQRKFNAYNQNSPSAETNQLDNYTHLSPAEPTQYAEIDLNAAKKGPNEENADGLGDYENQITCDIYTTVGDEPDLPHD